MIMFFFLPIKSFYLITTIVKNYIDFFSEQLTALFKNPFLLLLVTV